MPLPSRRPPQGCVDCEFRSMRIFCDLSGEARQDFQSIGIQMHLPPGAVLFQEDDTASSIAVVCEGQVKLQTTSCEGKTLILKIAMPGDVLGLGAVISQSCYEVTAETLEPTIVKSIRRDEFLSFLNRNGQASMHAARVLSEEYKTTRTDWHLRPRQQDASPRCFWISLVEDPARSHRNVLPLRLRDSAAPLESTFNWN